MALLNKILGSLQNDDGSISPTLKERQPADGDGLLFQKASVGTAGKLKRNIISWLVPEFGIIKMYVNPNNLVFTDKKLINKTRTKGGYTLQYWGEDLTGLSIRGTTGSSGIEGINALYEIYRSEQLAFDTQGLILDSQNMGTLSQNLAGELTNQAGNLLGIGSETISGILGLNNTNTSLISKNIPSLAQNAFTIEMYYNNAAYRGFFESMTVTESAENFHFQYSIEFTITQKRGYRRNYLPFHRHPNGPSNYDSPHTFSRNVENGEFLEPES